MEQADIRRILLQIFTEREIYDMQLKYHSAVCAQPPRYYTANNVILEKLGGLPKEEVAAYDDYKK